MHSSGMRTVRSLTVFLGLFLLGGGGESALLGGGGLPYRGYALLGGLPKYELNRVSDTRL